MFEKNGVIGNTPMIKINYEYNGKRKYLYTKFVIYVSFRTDIYVFALRRAGSFATLPRLDSPLRPGEGALPPWLRLPLRWKGGRCRHGIR